MNFTNILFLSSIKRDFLCVLGELTAYCMGPHQVAYCELEDNHDGTFRLGVKAQESGRHVLQIKYGGEHVQGVSFMLSL